MSAPRPTQPVSLMPRSTQAPVVSATQPADKTKTTTTAAAAADTTDTGSLTRRTTSIHTDVSTPKPKLRAPFFPRKPTTNLAAALGRQLHTHEDVVPCTTSPQMAQRVREESLDPAMRYVSRRSRPSG